LLDLVLEFLVVLFTFAGGYLIIAGRVCQLLIKQFVVGGVLE